MSAGLLWRVTLTVPDAVAAEAVLAALDPLLVAVSAFEGADEKTWHVEGLSPAPPDRGLIAAHLALVWRDRTGEPPVLAVERLQPHDWVSANQASFPPLAIGRYFIYGSHWGKKPPVGRVGLLIDAATAFGTGEHATTRGCLLALDGLTRRGARRRVLDMGTGTGILAIAAAKTGRRRVIARDIDGAAARVAGRNAAANGVGALVRAGQSAGYRDRGVDRAAPYDLVFANILARPLALMARDLARVLRPGGVAVLSGLLARQEAYVLAAHRQRRLFLVRRIAIDGWHTLIVSAGPVSQTLRRIRP